MQLTILLNLVQTLTMVHNVCLGCSVCVHGVHRDNFIFSITCIYFQVHRYSVLNSRNAYVICHCA